MGVRELTARFGAEVVGFDPERDLAGEGATRLRSLLDDHGVLLFRGAFLDREVHERLIQLLSGQTGLSDEYAEGPVADIYVSNKEARAGVPFGRLMFHTDMMWADHPYEVTSLQAVQVEPPVQPTFFAGAASAWETLPADLRARVADAQAVHVNDAAALRGTDDGELLHITYERPLTTTKPVALVHPRTGRTVLYVSQMMTKEIVGLDPSASEALLEELFAHLYDPANRWEHAWEEGDLIVWDNLAVQHARPDVRVDGPVRTLRKVSSATASRGTAGRATFSRAG